MDITQKGISIIFESLFFARPPRHRVQEFSRRFSQMQEDGDERNGQVVRQLHAEPFEGDADLRFHRARRQLEFRRDVGDALVVEAVHGENFPALRRQLGDGLFDAFPQFGFHVVIPRQRAGHFPSLQGLFLVGIADFQMPQVVKGAVADGRKEVGFQVFVVQHFLLFPHGGEHVVHDVFRRGRVARHARGVDDQPRIVGAEQSLEKVCVFVRLSWRRLVRRHSVAFDSFFRLQIYKE